MRHADEDLSVRLLILSIPYILSLGRYGFAFSFLRAFAIIA